MQINNLLRFDYWLDAAVVNQPAGRAMWLVVIAGLIGCAVVGALFARRRIPRDAAIAWIIASGLVSLVGIGRLFAIPVLGLRMGWLIAAIVALAPIIRRAARNVNNDGLGRDCLDAMAFAPLPHPLAHGEELEARADWHLSTAALWLGYNLVGTAVIFANINLPSLYAPLLLLVILTPVFVAFAIRASRRLPLNLRSLSCLAPLTIVYTTALFNLSGEHIEGVLSGVIYVPLSLIVMSAYAFAISCRWSVVEETGLSEPPNELTGRDRSPQRSTPGTKRGSYPTDTPKHLATILRIGDRGFVKWGAVALIAATFGWAIWTALTIHTHGVTGSDPYAYAQMGVDLATRGTVFHTFPLVSLTYDVGISSFPIVHVGYRIPHDVSRTATTVWPPGYAIFTALAFIAGGENGLYLITPLLSLISLLVVAWFAATVVQSPPSLEPVEGSKSQASNAIHEESSHDARFTSYAVVALTVFLTATSYQQVEWQMTPMADIAVQLFSILALTLALRASRSWVMAALSGLALGIAFDIRYTQVLIAPAIALALWLGNKRSPIAHRLLPIIICTFAALIAALPVLIYHSLAFGSPFRTGSEELTNFSMSRLPETLLRTLSELNTYREYRWLTPLLVIGVIVLWRRRRGTLAVLATYFVVLFAFHVAYAYLRLRDILFLFPVLNVLVAIGTVEGVRWMLNKTRAFSLLARLATITAISALSFMFVLRTMETLSLPVSRGFNSFGYLVPGQRASFARLVDLTPSNAVVGSALNSGAIDLYSRRLTFRPATWQPDELTKFVNRLHEQNTPVFLLDDGEELKPSLQTLRQHFQFSEVGRVDVPYYFKGSGSENRRVPLYEIGPAR